ncbi:MAG: hypothetical protein MZV70_54585 [Desulfobacterales bacterium]|nr:hypothetical protein [Desulfobacterales bacterium]
MKPGPADQRLDYPGDALSLGVFIRQLENADGFDAVNVRIDPRIDRRRPAQ